MKKITKKIVGLALTAGLALTVGVGVANVCDSYKDTTITASAATNIDVASTIRIRDCGSTGDYSDTPLYRVLLTENDSAAYDFGAFCPNEYGGEMLKWIKINGKSIYDHRAEYQAAVAAGEREPVTSKQGNIGGNLSADNAYAPIFVWVTSHGSLSAKAIDIYIANDYMTKDQVESIEITTDFTTDYIHEKKGTTPTETYTLSQNVYWAIGGGVRTTKYLGGKPAYTTSTVTVKAPYILINEATNFFSTELVGSDYGSVGGNAVNPGFDKTLIDTLNFWNYVELNGVKLNKLITDSGIPGEVGFNVWGAASAFSFRFPSFTADYLNSLTEIKYLKGCQFPSATNPTTAGYELAEDVTFVKFNGNWVNKESVKTAEDVTFGGGYIAGSNKEIVKFEIAIKDCAWTEDTRDGFDWNYSAGQALRESIKINGKSLYEIAKTVDDSSYVYTGTMANAGQNDDGVDRFQNPAILQGNIKDTNNVMHVWVHQDYLATLGDEVTITLSAGAQNWTKDVALMEDASQTYYRYADGSYGLAKAEEVATEVTEISTMIHGYNFITFYLTEYDLPQDTEGLKIINIEDSAQYTKANVLDYIYVNGKPVKEMNPGEFILNLAGPNTISIRVIAFGQEGDEGFDKNVFTAAIEKIEIKAGCQFPAYSYAFENGAVKFYEIAEDMLWVYDGAKWVDECNVTITDEAGNTVSSETVAPLTVLTEPETPAKEVEEGYTATFLGWYNGDTKWDFSTPVKGDVTLTPKFEVKANYAKVTIPEANAAEDGTKVEVSGTVSAINTAWSEQYGNITVTIVDAEGNSLYVYRMKTNVAVGDIITVKGEMGSYNGSKQVAAGSTAEITGHDSSYDYTEMTILEAIAAEDNTNVIVTGTVAEIKTAYSEQYGNISVDIADDEGNRLYLYRLAGNVEVGQIIKVKGAMATYKGNRQLTGGTYEVVGTHECTNYADGKCIVCGADEPLPEYVEVYLQPGDNTITMAAGQYALAYMRAALKVTFTWTGEATLMAGRMPIANGDVVDYNPMMGAITITPVNAEAECTVVLTVAEYVEPVVPAQKLELGENAVTVTVEAYYCEGTEVEFTATEAGEYVLKAAEGEENADIGMPGEYGYDWITLPYTFTLAEGETVKFIVCTTAYMTLTEDTIDLVLEKVVEEEPDDSSSEPTTSEPADSSDEPTTSEPADSSDEPTTSEPEEEKKGGCGSVIGGVSAALTLIAAAAIVMKKKED